MTAWQGLVPFSVFFVLVIAGFIAICLLSDLGDDR